MMTIRKRARSLARPRRGQALVETALVLPLMLILVFGVAEIGMYMYDYVQASNCAREAARRAAVREAGADSPPYCLSSDLKPTVTPSGYITAPAGSEVTATVTSTHDWLVLTMIPGFPASTPINATVKMRMEGQKV